MKNVLALASVAGLTAAAAAAPVNVEIDRSAMEIYSATATSIDSILPVGRTTTQYSNISSDTEGFFGITETAATDLGLGIVGDDDYQSIASNNISLTEFTFVGGAVGNGRAGGVVFFDFFDAGGNFVDGFGANLNQDGNFIWTLTIGTPFEIAAGGFVQMLFDDENLAGLGAAASATFFLTADDATVGNNLSAGFGSPGGNDLNHAFEIVGNEIPTPGAMAVLGMAGLAATRRRR